MAVDIQVEDLHVTFSTPGGTLPAVGPLSFRLDSGQFVCLVGPSGCGKSTLIRILAGLLRPTDGYAWIGDTPAHQASSKIGLMFQDANLMPWRTIRDNIALPLEIAGIAKPQRYAQAEELLRMLSLEDFALSFPGELSGGMAQRTALGRVLVQEPEVLLLDEPFGALDALTRERVSMDLLNIWSRKQQTVLMVTHDIQEAILLSDRLLVMSQRPGRIIADINIDLPRPRQLNDRYTEQFTQLAKQVRAAIDPA